MKSRFITKITIGISVIVIIGILVILFNKYQEYDLNQRLNDSDSTIRWNAIKELMQKKDSRVVQVLIAELNNKNFNYRFKALKALGDLKDPRAIGPLISAFNVDWDDYQFEASRALTEIGSPAVEPLITTLNDTNHTVRELAALTLGEIKDPRAVNPLLTLMKKDKFLSIQERSAYALGKIGTPSLEPLLKEIKNDNWEIRSVVSGALGMINDKRAVEPLINALQDEHSEVRYKTAYALGKISDPRVVEPLISALNDKAWEVRFASAQTLAAINDPRRIEPLVQGLNTKDMAIIIGAYVFFIEIGKSGSEPLLIEALNKFGDRQFTTIAYDYYNCGNPELAKAAELWAETNKMTIPKYLVREVPKWGSRR